MGLVASPSQYAQPADLQSVGLLGTFLQTVPVADQTAALKAASAIMDSYLGQQFTLPIQQWSFDVQQYCCWITAYVLVQQRGYNPGNAAEETFKERYDISMKWLKDVANGIATPAQILDSSPNAQPGTPAPAAQPQVTSPGIAAGLSHPTWDTWARR